MIWLVCVRVHACFPDFEVLQPEARGFHWGFVATCCQKRVNAKTKFKFGEANVISSALT